MENKCNQKVQPATRALLLAPAEGFFMLFWLTLDYFWCSLVTSVTCSSNLSNFQKNPKHPKKIQRNTKYPKISNAIKNPKNLRKSHKNTKKTHKINKKKKQ